MTCRGSRSGGWWVTERFSNGVIHPFGASCYRGWDDNSQRVYPHTHDNNSARSLQLKLNIRNALATIMAFRPGDSHVNNLVNARWSGAVPWTNSAMRPALSRPSLINLMVSVDVKLHVYLLSHSLGDIMDKYYGSFSAGKTSDSFPCVCLCAKSI